MDGHSDPSLTAFAQTVTQVGGWQKHPTAVVDPSVIVMPGAYIGPRVQVAAGCVIGANSVIGAPGLGYVTDEHGRHTYREHTMGVLIRQDVTVGSLCTVVQGRHRPTVLGRGTKLDDHVHVAHNAQVGEDCLLTAHVMLAGTVTIGDRVRLAPGCLVRDWRTVGDDALVGVGAVVVKDVAAGAVVAGNPARERRCES